MSTNLSIQSNEKAAVTGTFVGLLPRLVASVLAMAAILFIPAGRLGWVMGWAFIGVHAVYFAVNLLLIVQRQPDLIAERSRIVTEDTKGWDKVFAILASPLLLGAWVLAGLNVRFGWSPQPGLPIQFAALVLMVLGYTKRQPFKWNLFYWLPEFATAKVLRGLLNSRFAEIAFAQHAKVAVDEMRSLADEFKTLIDRTSLPTPNIDRLRAYLA